MDRGARNPGATAMTRVDRSHWTITLPFEDGQHPQYKYTRGTWDAVEKDAGCGEIPNRTVEVDFGGGGAQTIEDVVAKCLKGAGRESNTLSIFPVVDGVSRDLAEPALANFDFLRRKFRCCN